MINFRSSLIPLFFCAVMLFSTGIILAQSQPMTATYNDLHIIDTSEYIPSFYDGALNYNLMIASSRGYSSEIIRLISRGAEINSCTAEGATPLVFAVSNNHTDAVKTILNYKPLVNELTANYETPLHIAVKNCNLDITELLIRGGSDPDITDRHGATPLHYASLYQYTDIVDLLLYYDASIDIKSKEGFTPLHASIRAGYADVADILIQNGANMEARDKEGFTPFLTAAYYGDTLIMDLLIKNGVDIYTVTNKGYNALGLTILSNQSAATLYLLKKGDKWLTSGNDAIDPYSVVSKYRRKEIGEILKSNNVEGNVKYGFDQVSVSLSSRFCRNDIYTGLSLSLTEPYLNGGLIAGFDTKLWYTRVLVRSNENLFYQYMDKGSVAYAGIFKDFALTDRIDGFNYSFNASMLAGYTFGNKLKGTLLSAENKLYIIPSLALKMTKMNFSATAGLEYMKTDYFKNGPIWFRVGLSYNYFFDDVRTKVKAINWY